MRDVAETLRCVLARLVDFPCKLPEGHKVADTVSEAHIFCPDEDYIDRMKKVLIIVLASFRQLSPAVHLARLSHPQDLGM